MPIRQGAKTLYPLPSIHSQTWVIWVLNFGQNLTIYRRFLAILQPIRDQGLATKLPCPRYHLSWAFLGCPIVKNGGHVLWKVVAEFLACSHLIFLLLHFAPPFYFILILALSQTPLIYPIIPLRPSSLVIFVSPSKFLKNYHFDFSRVNLENYI